MCGALTEVAEEYERRDASGKVVSRTRVLRHYWPRQKDPREEGAPAVQSGLQNQARWGQHPDPLPTVRRIKASEMDLEPDID